MKPTILKNINVVTLTSFVAISFVLFSGWRSSTAVSNVSDLSDKQVLLIEEATPPSDSLLQLLIDNYDEWRKDDNRYNLVIKELTSSLMLYDGTVKDLQKIIETNNSFCSSVVERSGSQDSTLLKSIAELSLTKKKLEVKQKALKTKLKDFEEKALQHKANQVTILKELNQVCSDLAGEGSFNFSAIPYSFYITDLSMDEIDFHLKDPKGKKNYGSIKNLLNSEELAGRKVEMVTNGGMYKPNHQPQGLYVEERRIISPLDTMNPDNHLNFYLLPNGVFLIDTLNQPKVMSTD